MQHSEKFLAVVNDAKSRIREITVDEVKADVAAGANFLLVDTREDSEWDAAHAAGSIHLGKGIIERDIEGAVPDEGTSWCFIAAEAIAQRLPRTCCRIWATPTYSR